MVCLVNVAVNIFSVDDTEEKMAWYIGHVVVRVSMWNMVLPSRMGPCGEEGLEETRCESHF